MGLLTDEEITAALEGSAWRRDGAEIVRDLTFGDFKTAIGFVNRVAEAAEAANHHPDIRVYGYKNVELKLSSHSEGGLTANDLELARTLDGLA